MKTTIVNHGGVVQRKFIIRNTDDLMAYEKVNAEQHGESLVTMCHAKTRENEYQEKEYTDKRHQLIDITAQKNKVSHFAATYALANQKIMNMLKSLQNGQVLVVNMAGGYTYWNDQEMCLVDESEYDAVNDPDAPQVNIFKTSVLILENDREIPKEMLSFVQNELNQRHYSSITHLSRDYDQKIGQWLTKALQSGCDTVVAQTQLVNQSQIEQMAGLFEKMPPLTFYISTSGDLKRVLIETIGQEMTDKVYQKHHIVLI